MSLKPNTRQSNGVFRRLSHLQFWTSSPQKNSKYGSVARTSSMLIYSKDTQSTQAFTTKTTPQLRCSGSSSPPSTRATSKSSLSSVGVRRESLPTINRLRRRMSASWSSKWWRRTTRARIWCCLRLILVSSIWSCQRIRVLRRWRRKLCRLSRLITCRWMQKKTKWAVCQACLVMGDNSSMEMSPTENE